MIRVLIVDDEPVARGTIRTLLSQVADIQIIGECGTGEEAAEALALEEVDLVFLDIDMPGILGLDVVDRIPPEQRPLVVFVTAHGQHAVRAFELSALDYVLKPFDDHRFHAAVQRARSRLSERRIGTLGDDLRALAVRLAGLDTPLPEHPEGAPSGVDAGGSDPAQGPSPDQTSGLANAPVGAGRGAPLRRFAIRSSSGVEFVDTEDIDWIEAEDSYVRLHTGSRFHLMRETMTRLESVLDPARFVRVHRSAIVHVDRVKKLVPLEHGDSKLVLENGTEVRVSRTRRASVRESLGLGSD